MDVIPVTQCSIEVGNTNCTITFNASIAFYPIIHVDYSLRNWCFVDDKLSLFWKVFLNEFSVHVFDTKYACNEIVEFRETVSINPMGNMFSTYSSNMMTFFFGNLSRFPDFFPDFFREFSVYSCISTLVIIFFRELMIIISNMISFP